MLIKNAFVVKEEIEFEMAVKLYHYNKNIVFLYKRGFKNFLLNYGIPNKNLLVLSKIYKENSGYFIENLFCRYQDWIKNSNFKNRYRIDYGYGNGNFVFNENTEKSEKEKGFVCSSEYQKQRYEEIRTTPGIILGNSKFDEFVHEQMRFKKTKPMILYLHTWKKNKPIEDWIGKSNGYKYSGETDIEATAKILEQYTDKFEIVHKNHHLTSFNFDKFTNIKNGTVDSYDLIKQADIIIAEYGGSAVEAVLGDGKLIYVDDDNLESCCPTNLDTLVHYDFNHCKVSELKDMIDKVLEMPISNEEIENKKKWREKYFPCRRCGAKNIAEFMESL